MKLTAKKSNVRMLTSKDPAFHIVDSMTITNRAGVQIMDNCPDEYKQLLHNAVGYGWIRPVAYMREDELMWIQLKEEN
jgi:hypothetical protein